MNPLDSTLSTDWGDRAFDLLSKGITEIANLVKQVAPELWRMVGEKLWAEAWAEAILGTFFLIVAVCFVPCAIRLGRKCQWLDFGPTGFAVLIGLAISISLSVAIIGWVNIVLLSYAQDYYILKEIISMTTGR